MGKVQPLILPRRKLVLPKERRRLPDVRFPHIWVPRRRVIAPTMAVTLDATSTSAINDITGTNPYDATGNINVGVGLTNGFLLVTVFWDILATATSCQWNAVNMNSIGAATNTAGTLRAEMFGLKNPASGNNHVRVAWTGTATELMIACISFSNVDQTTPTANFTSTSNGSLSSGQTASLTVSAGTSDAVVAGWFNDFTWSTAVGNPNHTILVTTVNGNSSAGAWNYVLPSAASNTMSCINGTTTDDYCSVAVDIVAAAGTLFMGWEPTIADSVAARHAMIGY